MNMVDTVAALVLNVGLNLALIPQFGINGASVAWTVSLTLIGVLRAIQVHHYVIHTYPLSWRVFKGLAAALGSIAVGVPLEAWLPWRVGVARRGRRHDGGVRRRAGRPRLGGRRPAHRARHRRACAPGPRPPGHVVSGPAVIAGQRIKAARESLREIGRGLSPRYRPGSEALVIDELISPLRYDVLVRSQLFELLAAERACFDRSPDAFVDLARQTDYHRWFTVVAVHAIGIAGQPEAGDRGGLPPAGAAQRGAGRQRGGQGVHPEAPAHRARHR